jgi:hypothetical protein
MRWRALLAVLAALVSLASACNDPARVQHEGQGAPGSVPPTTDPEPGTVVGPGGEMIPGLALPAKLEGQGEIPAGASRDDLLAVLRRALDEDRGADAVAIADVLLVFDPADAEALELRARALDLQGDAAGAADDRKRCCDLGRAGCCR